jgi:hypothetical protein
MAVSPEASFDVSPAGSVGDAGHEDGQGDAALEVKLRSVLDSIGERAG